MIKIMKKALFVSVLVVFVGCGNTSNGKVSDINSTVKTTTNEEAKLPKKDVKVKQEEKAKKDSLIITENELLPKNFTLNHELFFIHRSGKSMGSSIAEILITSLKASRVQRYSDGSVSVDNSPLKITSKYMDDIVEKCKDNAKRGHDIGSDQYKVFFHGCISTSYFSLREYFTEEWETAKILFPDE